MAETQIQKILAQSTPAALTPEVLYTAPTQGRAIIRSLFVCNRSAAFVLLFKLAVVPNGIPPATKHYLFFNQSIPVNDTYRSDIPIYLNSSDYINIETSTDGGSFTIFGNEE